MRAAGKRGWHSLVTAAALGNSAGMSLYIDAQHIIINMGAWVFGMSRTMAGFALQLAMPGAEAIQTESGCRCIGIGRETRIARAYRICRGIQRARQASSIVVA